MPEYYVIIAATAALAALSALTFLALRLRRARSEFQQEVAAWKMRLDQDLKQAHRERDKMLDALAESFFLIDAQERIIFVNKAGKAMFPERTILGRTVSEIFLDRRLADPILLCLESGKDTTTRIVLSQQSSPLGRSDTRGSNAWIVDAARISEAPDDAPIIRVVIRDVTSEHNTEQIRKDFVANASHELRTPLAIINGYLENLIDDGLAQDAEVTERFLKVMRKHTERIARIVEDMLVISRLESGEAAALKIRPFRLRSCIHDVLERLESVIRGQDAHIHIEMTDEELMLFGDRFYWTQVLFNLIENALKQNPRKDLNIKIGCIRDVEGTKIWISDDGIGIPSNDLPHIFRRFYRVEKHHSQEEIKGTGLGLSIVKRAIEAHEGTIDVNSTPGVETRFTIQLPPQPSITAVDAEADSESDQTASPA